MFNVLITGCSGGIGYHVAKGLKERGHKIYATARKIEDVERLRDEGFRSLQLDISHSESIHDAINEMQLLTGNNIYAVFHNAAYGQMGAVEDISRAVLEAQFATNFFGWHELNLRVLPLMRNQGYGRIIYNSSVLGYVTLPFRGAYNASKYAVEGLASTLRQELNETNIHVSLIQPGPIESHFRANALIAFKANINIQKSLYRDHYQSMIARLEKEGAAVPFTLPPDAVLKKVIHALESPKPKLHYPVTVPAHLFAYLKRLLPARWLDKVLLSVGDRPKR